MVSVSFTVHQLIAGNSELLTVYSSAIVTKVPRKSNNFESLCCLYDVLNPSLCNGFKDWPHRCIVLVFFQITLNTKAGLFKAGLR